MGGRAHRSRSATVARVGACGRAPRRADRRLSPRHPAVCGAGCGSDDIAETALTAWLLFTIARRWPRGDTSRDFVALTVAAVAAPLFTGLLGAVVELATYGGSYTEAWLNWWLGDATGILLVVPVALSFARSSPRPRPHSRLGGLVEVGLVVGIAIAMFGFTTTPVEFLMLLPIVLVAMRHGLRLTAGATLILAIIAGGLHRARLRGPFSNYSNSARILGLQAFIATGAAVAFLINATISERRRAEAALAELATHDALTGLANRRWFMERMDDVCARREPRRRSTPRSSISTSTTSRRSTIGSVTPSETPFSSRSVVA